MSKQAVFPAILKFKWHLIFTFVLLSIHVSLSASSLRPLSDYLTSKIDSLESRLPVVKGEEKALTLSRLVHAYSGIDFEKSFEYFSQASVLFERLELNRQMTNLFVYISKTDTKDQRVKQLELAIGYCKREKLTKCEIHGIIQLGIQYLRDDDLEKAFYYFNHALDLSNSIAYNYGQAAALQRIGRSYHDTCNYIQAMKYYYDALSINQQNGYHEEVAVNQYLIGLAELEIGNYHSAIDYILHALEFWEQTNNVANMWNSNELLGNIYIKMKDFVKALHFHRIALDIRLKNINRRLALGVEPEPENFLGIAYSHNNIAEVYYNRGHYDSAHYYAISSLRIKEAKNSVASTRDKGNSYLNLGNIYHKMNMYDSAFIMLDKAYVSFSSINNKSSIAETLYGQGALYLSTGQNEKALHAFEEGLKLAAEVNDQANIKSGYKHISEVYVLLEDYRKALENHILYSGIKDTIFSKDRANIIEELQLKYETGKRQQEIAFQKELVLKKQRQLRIAVLGLISFLALSVIVLFLILKTRKQQIRIFEKEKESLLKDLELKNKELVCNVTSIYTKNMVINKVAKTLSGNMHVFKQVNVGLVREIIGELRQSMDEVSWKEFEMRFAKVHESFYQHLDAKFPDLTPTERRICAMLKLGLCSKEIGAITMTKSESVDTARSRIRKKLGLNQDENLTDYLSGL